MYDYIYSQIQLIFVEPYSSLVAGVLLGKGINHLDTIRLDLINSGLIHIMVLSGTNIAILAIILYRLLFRIDVKIKSIILIACILFYNVLTGFMPSMVRASIVGTLNALGVITGKKVYAGYTLFIAFLVMLVYDISILESISFLLSFGASLGIVLFQEDLSYFLQKHKLKTISKELSTSISAQLGVSPFLIYFFGTTTLWGTISNLLVSPVVGVLTIISFFLVGAKMLFGITITPFVYLVQFGFDYILFVAHFFAQLPLSVVEFGF